MSFLKKIFIDSLIIIISTTVVFGALELSIRKFYSHKLRTYFDHQTERALGYPVPKKEKDEYRIFIFGGSSAYGFPVSDRYSIAAWLRKSFPQLLPDKNVKIINCGWPGKASHHVLEGARTVLKYQPDLFIVYEGHNDFTVSNRLFLDNWLYRMNLRLYYSSAFYRWLHKKINKARKKLVYGRAGHTEKHYREEVIAKKVYEKTEVNEKEYQRIVEGWSRNMKKLLKIAKRHGIDVMFLNMPSNIRGIPPSFSANNPSLTENELKQWKLLYEKGQAAEKKGNIGEALNFYKRAARIDSTYAGLQYRLGKVYEKVGNYTWAKASYILAKDYDGFSSRARSALNNKIKNTAQNNDSYFVDVVGTLEKVSPHGILSTEIIYDDVHPTVEAQQLITEEILKVLSENNWKVPQSEWRWKQLEGAKTEDKDGEWEVDGSVNAYRYVLKGLKLWENGYYEEAIPDLEKGLELMPHFLDSYAFLGDAYYRTKQYKKASRAFSTLFRKDPALFKLLLNKYPEVKNSYSKLSKAA